MILTDYLLSEKNSSWILAGQMGIKYATVRLPEDKDFDVCNLRHWQDIYNRFINDGFTPVVIEPVPNDLHDHIKIGDEQRDSCIEKVICMLGIMDKLNIRTLCVNFMAHIGWYRNFKEIRERGGALVTGFDIEHAHFPDNKCITKEELWNNLEYFLKTIMPYADKYNIKIALHPDDPPVEALGNVERILTSFDAVKKALDIVKSSNLGVTFCQATFSTMGEDLEKIVPELARANKIFFIHFRNVIGDKNKFRETFHDNGQIDMNKMIQLYRDYGCNVPIRVDHVPTMFGEDNAVPGYASLGRLYAVGYLKGLLEANGVSYI